MLKVDVEAPYDTKVIVDHDRTTYYYLIEGIVYTKVDGLDAPKLYPNIPPDILDVVPESQQLKFKSRIEDYYRNHPPFMQHQF